MNDTRNAANYSYNECQLCGVSGSLVIALEPDFTSGSNATTQYVCSKCWKSAMSAFDVGAVSIGMVT